MQQYERHAQETNYGLGARCLGALPGTQPQENFHAPSRIALLFAAVIGQTAPGAINLDVQGTQEPSGSVNHDAPAADESWLLPPELVLIAEKVPCELPNGQILILKDHKVDHNQIRYEVDGMEFKPAVGETLAFPGPGFDVYVTCSRWKLLKKQYGEDSAEFMVESFPAP